LKSWNVEFDSENADRQVHHGAEASANQNTQLHTIISHSTITSQTISHFTAPPSHPTVTTVDKSKKWWT
jgi:hypothetical protein